MLDRNAVFYSLYMYILTYHEVDSKSDCFIPAVHMQVR